jgi:hypothetical protein
MALAKKANQKAKNTDWHLYPHWFSADTVCEAARQKPGKKHHFI